MQALIPYGVFDILLRLFYYTLKGILLGKNIYEMNVFRKVWKLQRFVKSKIGVIECFQFLIVYHQSQLQS